MIIYTFLDIKQAYDRADMDDMMYTINKEGLKDKPWRLAQILGDNLVARVKTKAGLTRIIKRETGGKQGGKLMVPLFAKMMDCLTEDISEDPGLGIFLGPTRIPALLYVDDAAPLAEGYPQQENTLRCVDEFGTKHKLEFQETKCKVMEIGNHKEKRTKWKMGQKEITNCESYTYLGETLMRNGKNTKNLDKRINKVKAAVRAVASFAKGPLLRGGQMKVLIMLHEAVNIPTLLYCAETWTLSKGEFDELDRLELWSWKKMIGLPKTTPNAAVMYVTGALYPSIRIQMGMLLYLHRLLNKGPEIWSRIVLEKLDSLNIGWAKQVRSILSKWSLPCEWESIRSRTTKDWTKTVRAAAEVVNRARIREECIARSRGETSIKTKTKKILDKLDDPNYKREPEKFTLASNTLAVRAMIMGRYGMLQCAANFKGTYGSKNCRTCNVVDDETHRMNVCPLWGVTNWSTKAEKADFSKIHSEVPAECMEGVKNILKMWQLARGKNTMSEQV